MNSDTKKAIEAVRTLTEYCGQQATCEECGLLPFCRENTFCGPALWDTSGLETLESRE